MNYEQLKLKYANLNWREAEEQSDEDLIATSEYFDRLIYKIRNNTNTNTNTNTKQHGT